MSDRLLISLACVPMICGIVLLVMLSRVPARALSGEAAIPAPTYAANTVAAQERGWVGVIVATNTAELAADGTGRVEAVYVRTGDKVLRGMRLLQFDRAEASSSVHMANAQLSERVSGLTSSQARAKAAAQRLSRLRAGETWLSKQELDNAVAEVQVADAELQAARANLNASRIALKQQRVRATRQTLTAPFDGTVIALGVDEGDSVVPGQVVLRILSEQMQARFAFPPGEAELFEGRKVKLRLQGTDQELVTPVDAVRPEVDPSAQLVFATASLPELLPDPSRWMPGAVLAVTPLDP